MNDDDRPLRAVYEQYWLHARHIEDEMWSFTRIWAIVVTAVLTVVGADLPVTAKVGASLFAVLLSLLGFFVVYTLRIPFLDFVLKAELLAADEFGTDPRYLRFHGREDFRLDKGVDVPDVLVATYAAVATLMTVVTGVVVGRTRLGVLAGAALGVVLACVYVWRVTDAYRETVTAAAADREAARSTPDGGRPDDPTAAEPRR